MKKRILSVLLCLCLVLTLLPATALATGEGSTSISSFTELQTAFSTGGDYTLTQDITVTAQLTLAADKTLTIHGNNHTIQPAVTGLNEQGIVNDDATVIENIISNSGTLTLENLTIYGGKGRCISNSGTLTMTGVSLERAHLASGYGAGLYNSTSSAKACLTNCNIRRNGCDSSGGGFYNSGTLILENCAIVENRNFGNMKGGGAGENSGSSARLYMNNCTVANNQSTEVGGGLNNYSGTAYIMNSTFTGNVTTGDAAKRGGGIGNNGGTVYAVNSVFAFNYANGTASDIGLYSSDGTVTLYNCAYGAIVKSDSTTESDTRAACKKLTTENTSTTFARPVITQDGGTYGVYPAASSELKSGGTKTYYDRTDFTVKMSYDSSSTNTALGGLGTASTEVTRPGGGDTSGLIGALPKSASFTASYTVKVNPATGSTVTGGSAQGNSYPAGTNISITAVPSAGYTFSGWKVGAGDTVSSYANPYTIDSLSADVTLTPVFAAAPTYTVTYFPGTNGTGSQETDTKTQGIDLPLRGAIFTRTGYTQTGWATSDGGNKAYELSGTYSADTAVSLYPVWTADTYAVTLDTKGGTINSGNVTTYIYGVGATLPTDVTQAGYTFGGWYDNESLSGTVTVSGGHSISETFNVSFTVNALGDLETVTFNYAYDAQRDPAYPTSGADITFSSLTAPYGPSGSNSGQTSDGSWTLTRAGTYFYLDNTSTISNALKSLANTIANQYSDAGATDAEKTAFKNSLVIHELKKGDTHYAYGVVVAYNANSGYAAFIGDSLSQSAGYLLSVNALTDSVTTKADMVATDFVPSLSISLSQTENHTFPAAIVGYGEQTALEVTVTNTGNAATGALAVTLTGDNASSFTLGDVDSGFTGGIAAENDTDTFTVRPNTGLAADTYTATVTVSGANIVSNSFNVTFTVSAGGSYIPSSYKVDIQLPENANGTVSAKPGTAQAGNTVTITVTPDEGYQLDSLTVKDQNGKELAVTDNGDGTFTFRMPTGKVTVEATFVETVKPVVNPFIDVEETDYFYDAVMWAVEQGITIGTTTTTFNPDNICTRAEIVSFLWRAEGSADASAENPFTDVSSDAYYAEAVSWAAENNITEGTSATTFSPVANCTRAQIVSFLYHCMVH